MRLTRRMVCRDASLPISAIEKRHDRNEQQRKIVGFSRPVFLEQVLCERSGQHSKIWAVCNHIQGQDALFEHG